MKQEKTVDAFYTILKNAKDDTAAAKLVIAQQDLIAYYYDVLKAKARQLISGGSMERVPVEAAQEAVRTVNTACVNQKAPRLFTGKIDNPADLFRFAGHLVPETTAA